MSVFLAFRPGYDALDKLIARTYCRKTQLLMALRHPEIELHNNPAELGFGIGFANVKSVLAMKSLMGFRLGIPSCHFSPLLENLASIFTNILLIVFRASRRFCRFLT
ncbi:MAG: hypothetical protein Q9P01_19375 [Anaerolineae bacterium]|nr:hypothetical protein [Anaerolineae bacterium]